VAGKTTGHGEKVVVRILVFAWRYLCALASTLYVFSVGFIFARNRGLILGVCEHFGLAGMRKRPVTERPVPVVPAFAAAELVSKGVPIRVLEPNVVDGNVSLFELFIIANLIQTLRPTRLLEIGTFDGRTTLNLAANSPPGAVVFTLDLPKDSLNSTLLPLAPFDAKYIGNQATGCRFAGAEYQNHIVQLWGDSAAFDFSPFVGTMDFVFIDGAHSYQYVLQDSRTALRLLRNGRGVILWHDYDTPWWTGVTQALNELFLRGGAFGGLRRIEGTALAYMAVGVNPCSLPGAAHEAGIADSVQNA
jgi:SAM-dependent methyltransferase